MAKGVERAFEIPIRSLGISALLPRRLLISPLAGAKEALSCVGPFARDSDRFVIRLLIGGTKKPR
jgi:hypothetical protein